MLYFVSTTQSPLFRLSGVVILSRSETVMPPRYFYSPADWLLSDNLTYVKKKHACFRFSYGDERC